MNKKIVFNLAILLALTVLQLVTVFMPSSLNTVYFSIIRPVGYIVLVTLTCILIGVNFGFNKKKQTSALILILGVMLYLGLLFFVGIFESFGKNPMTPTLAIFLKNVWNYVPFVIIGEIIRFQIMKNTDAKHRSLMMFAVVVVFSFVMLETLNNTSMLGNMGRVDYLMTTVLPIIVINFFLTYISPSGALGGIILFRAAWSLLPVLCPVLPNITPILLSIVLYVVIFVMFILYDKYAYENKFRELRKKKPYRWKYYLVPGLLLVILVVFGFGILPIMPVAVASDSMKGTFTRGDIVVIKKINEETAVRTLKEGDVIQFNDKNISIVHRIISVTADYRGNVQYVTKGDNNAVQDLMPVKPNQIVGVARAYIPVLGYPAVWLMELMRN